MKKVSWATHKSLFGQIAASTCLVAASAGIIFGVSAGTFKIQYMDLNNAESRLKAAIEHNAYSQNIISQWNMFEKGKVGDKDYVKGIPQPVSNVVTKEWWDQIHPGTTRLCDERLGIKPSEMQLVDAQGKEIPSGVPISDAAKAMRKQYAALVIDGATHTAMDRSFNQGLYNGIVNFNKNEKLNVTDDKDAIVYKPSQDSTQEFVNVYRAAAAKSRILSLAGFNHVTPLNALGKQSPEGIYEFSDANIANTGMMLMDGDISNNQNVASVLFRSDEPAFLTAIATGMYFYNNLHLYHDQFQDISVAAYGGTAIPTVVVYMGGYQRGIEFFNRVILYDAFIQQGARKYMTNGEQTTQMKFFIDKLLPASKHKAEVEQLRAKTGEKRQEVKEMMKKLYDEFSIKMIKLGDFGTHFSGSFTAGDAIGISKQLLNRGASAIIAVAGPQSLDTAQEVMNQNSKCIVIGVDSAMERSDYQKPFKTKEYEDRSTAPDKTKSAQANNIIKFSAVKDMTNVSDKMLRLAGRGLHWDIDNDKPWASAARIPAFADDETFNIDSFELHFDKTEPKFDIVGFKSGFSPTPKTHVMKLPLKLVNKGKTYYLDRVYGFNANNLSLQTVDTLCFEGTPILGQTVKFGDGTNSAFDYSNWSGTGKCPGIKYIDFSNLNSQNISLANDNFPIFKGMVESEEKSSTYHAGIIKFDPTESDNNNKKTYSLLFNDTEEGAKTPWPIIEPDPYKSICAFGFKTCGNIENGLISISWDGWPLLFEGLSFVRFSGGGGTNMPFIDYWNQFGSEYCKNHASEVTEDFAKMFDSTTTTPVEAFITYNPESPINKNYSHTMAILGALLNTCAVSFDADMTVLLDKDGKPYLPTQGVALTILDWLKYNMYFTL